MKYAKVPIVLVDSAHRFVCWSLTSLCHSNGHIETMPAREINPFTALTRIRSQLRIKTSGTGNMVPGAEDTPGELAWSEEPKRGNDRKFNKRAWWYEGPDPKNREYYTAAEIWSKTTQRWVRWQRQKKGGRLTQINSKQTQMLVTDNLAGRQPHTQQLNQERTKIFCMALHNIIYYCQFVLQVI